MSKNSKFSIDKCDHFINNCNNIRFDFKSCNFEVINQLIGNIERMTVFKDKSVNEGYFAFVYKIKDILLANTNSNGKKT